MEMIKFGYVKRNRRETILEMFEGSVDLLADLAMSIDLKNGDDLRATLRSTGFSFKGVEYTEHEVTATYKKFVMEKCSRFKIGYVFFAPSTGVYASRALEKCRTPLEGALVTPVLVEKSPHFPNRANVTLFSEYFILRGEYEKASMSKSDFEEAVGSSKLWVQDELSYSLEELNRELKKLNLLDVLFVISEGIPEMRGFIKP